MKIHHVNRMGAANPYYKQQDVKNTEKTASRSGQKDAVSISPQAKQLAASDPERTAKIEQLKVSVSNGTYQVDSRLLAEKLAPYFQ